MGKHYIPRFYLKGFTEKNAPSFIWAYEKGRKKPFRSNILNIAQENQIYSDETEKQLADDVENPANPIIHKIREQQPITKAEKEILARYVEVLMRRIPRVREKAREWFPSAMEKKLQHLESDLNRLSDENPDKEEIINKHKNDIKRMRNNDVVDLFTPEDIWEEIILSDDMPIHQVLGDMTWQFLVFDEWPIFLTSDNPVFFFEWMGIGKKYSEVSFPISKNIVLWATWRSDLKENYVKTTENIAKEINQRTVSFAQKYIFFSSHEKWVETLVNKDSLKVNRITQPAKKSRKRQQYAIR